MNTSTFATVTPPVDIILKGVKIYPQGPSVSAVMVGGAALVRRTSTSVSLSPILARMTEPVKIPWGDFCVCAPLSTPGRGALSTSPSQSTAAPVNCASTEVSVWSKTETRWCVTALKASQGTYVRDLVSTPGALKGVSGVFPRGLVNISRGSVGWSQ